MRANRWGPWWALDKVQQCRVHIAHLLRQKHILIPAFSSLEKTATFPFIYSGAVCCRDAQQTTLKFLFRPEFSDLKLENTAEWKNESKLIFIYSGTGYKPPVFFWSATNNSQISKWIFTKTNFQSFSMHLLTDYFESSVTAATLLPVTAY